MHAAKPAMVAMTELDRARASTWRWLGWEIAGLLAVGSARAQAQPVAQPPDATAAAPGDTSRPWAAGVSEAEQAAALELYLTGNLELAESRFAQALAKYRDAIRHWDHPAIVGDSVVISDINAILLLRHGVR